MKKIISLLVLLTSINIFGIEVPDNYFPEPVEKIVSGEKDAKEGINTTFIYNEDSLYLVYGRVNYTTGIMLNPDEKMTYITAGDTSRWNYEKTETGTSEGLKEIIYIKPSRVDINTNLTINTTKRIYNIKLISHKKLLNPIVKWRYPNEAFAKKIEKENKEEAVLTNADNLNFAYTVSTTKYDFSPLRIYDDGVKTFIVLKNVQEQPEFFIKEKSNLLRVNYRVKNNLLIVDRLFDEAILKIDKKQVILKRKK